MNYWVKVTIALVLCGVSIVAIDWGIWHLMLTGSCGSNGTYVSTRPCPPGTGLHILALIGGIFGGLIGIGIWTARGRSDQRIESRVSLPILMWALLFCTLSLSALYAATGPAAGSDAPTGTAIFLTVLFVPMGLAPIPFAFGMNGKVSAVTTVHATAARVPAPRPAAALPTSAATPVVEADGDPLEKIEKLGELRDKGLITAVEFEEQKARLLREV